MVSATKEKQDTAVGFELVGEDFPLNYLQFSKDVGTGLLPVAFHNYSLCQKSSLPP